MPKRKLLIAIGIVLLIGVIVAVILISGSCNRKTEDKPTTPNKLAALAKKAIESNQFADLQNLFSATNKERLSQQRFSDYGKLVAPTATYSNCVVIRMDNGQMLLLFISAPDNNGIYSIEDIKQIPEDMVTFFMH